MYSSKLAAVVGLLLFVASSTEAAAQSQKVYALIIGIDAYSTSPLPNCVNDAKDTASFLVRQGVPAKNIRVLTDRRATGKGIAAGLGWLIRVVPKDALAIVYYSGHGSRRRDRNREEADRWDETWVSQDKRHVVDDDLGSVLKRVKGKVLVISDSCHSGTVTKSIELGDDGIECTVEGEDGSTRKVRISGSKFIDPQLISDERVEFEGAAPETKSAEAGNRMIPRDIVVASAKRQRRNAQGGSTSREHSIDLDSVGLFASCSDQEVSNATRGRNSAFTDVFLKGLRQAPARVTFGWLLSYSDNRLRNRGYRYPQHPSLFNINPSDPLPEVFQRKAAGGTRPPSVAASEPASASQTGPGEDARVAVTEIIGGLWRREHSAPARRRGYIQSFQARGGRSVFNTGDALVLELVAKPALKQQLYACVFNVGPTGNMTLIYPNFHDRNPALTRGKPLVIGAAPSNIELRFQGEKGTENLVAYALEWNPFVGFDWDLISDSDHVYVSTGAFSPNATVTPGQLRETMLRARDIGVRAAKTRPGEGWDKRVLKVVHQ